MSDWLILVCIIVSGIQITATAYLHSRIIMLEKFTGMGILADKIARREIDVNSYSE